MAPLVHVVAAGVWLGALLELVGARWLLGGGEVFVRPRDLAVALVGAVVVGLCLAGVRRPLWPAVALAFALTAGVVVLHLTAAPSVTRVDFAFVAGSAFGGRELVAALVLGSALGLGGPAVVRRYS